MSTMLMLLFYPVIEDIRKQKFYIEPVLAIWVLFMIRKFYSAPHAETVFAVLAGLVPGTILGIICILTKEAVGAGDVVILLCMGTLTGWRDTLGILMTALILCGVLSLGLLLRKNVTRKATIPFVPFLMFGTIIWYFL